MNPLRDALNVIRKDWKLFALLNLLYVFVILIGAGIAFFMPGVQRSMIQFIGSDVTYGPLSSISHPYRAGDILMNAVSIFFDSFIVSTLAMITAPSIVMPIWAPIIGAARFFIWGVTLVTPLEGVLTFGNLIPNYVTMFIEGEAYVIAIFASVRQLVIALKAFDGSSRFRPLLKEYIKAVFDNAKLLLLVIVLLAIAALYEAWEVPFFAGIR